MCIQEEFGQLSGMSGNQVLNVSHVVQMPNYNVGSCESHNTDSSENTTKATVAPDTVYAHRTFGVNLLAGCMQPFTVLSNFVNKVIYSDKKGNQSKMINKIYIQFFFLIIKFFKCKMLPKFVLCFSR